MQPAGDDGSHRAEYQASLRGGQVAGARALGGGMYGDRCGGGGQHPASPPRPSSRILAQRGVTRAAKGQNLGKEKISLLLYVASGTIDRLSVLAASSSACLFRLVRCCFCGGVKV